MSRGANSYVYFMRPVGAEGPVKIGSSRLTERRLKAMAMWSPVPLEIATMIPGGAALEWSFHAKFEHLNTHYEWFRADRELSATIKAIRAKRFNIATLPDPKRLFSIKRSREPWSDERKALALLARRVRDMRRAAPWTVPGEVWTAAQDCRSANPDPASIARVREFLGLRSSVLREAA